MVLLQTSIVMAMMIGGVVETEESEEASAFFPELNAVRCYSSKKPAFTAGSSAAISLTKKAPTAQPFKKYDFIAQCVVVPMHIVKLYLMACVLVQVDGGCR